MSKHQQSANRARRAAPRLAVSALVIAATGLLAGCMSNDQVTAFDALNANRTGNQPAVAALPASDLATAKAQAWSQTIAANGALSHSTLADGYSSVRWCKLGENVGRGPSIADVETGFMNSTEHRTNILDPAWTAAGTGVTWVGTTVYVVQEFIETC